MDHLIIIPVCSQQITEYLAHRRRAKKRLPDHRYLVEFFRQHGTMPRGERLPAVSYSPDGILNREAVSALIYPDGSEAWFRDGRIHRDDGPAVIERTAGRRWYRNGVLHRDDAPAVIRSNARTQWWLDGQELKGVHEWFIENDFPHWTGWSDEQRILFRLRWGSPA
jgi:hypothetical protein